MSAYKRIACSLVDKTILISALKKLGLEPRIHEDGINLIGYAGDQRTQIAEIVVPRGQLNKKLTGASNDIGFKWNEAKKQYDMIVSDYDIHMGMDERVKQAYAISAIEQVLKDNRFDVEFDMESLATKERKSISLTARKII